jgi:F-type H+-transporting ATPase subunit a
LFRSINSDLNVTLALALISVGATHYYSISNLGIGDYLKRYFSLNPVNLFVGLLEIVAEFTKILSLSFRLFGNIFAGETLLVTISALFAFILPLPFLFLEIIVGFVQAAIFMMLTLVFMVILTEKHASH